MRRIFVASAALITMAAAAAAQTTTPSTSVDLHPLINELVPYVVAAVGAVITALGAFLVTQINKLGKKWGLEIDKAQQDKATTALTNAAAGIIQKVGPQIAMTLDAKNPAVAAAANEVLARIPDALNHLGITPASVAQRVLEKIPQVLPVDAPASPAAPKP